MTRPVNPTKCWFVYLLVAGCLLATISTIGYGQKSQPNIIANIRVDIQGQYGPLFGTINGKEKKIADEAQKAWLIAGGRQVVYSGPDGSGGFENEGQSLRIYDTRSGKSHKILSEYFMIEDVKEAVTSRKKTALLVTMEDGGLGASYVAVVDPSRGEVFFRRGARILERRGDILRIGFYKDEDWSELDTDQNNRIRPYKTETHNLNKVLRRGVIINKRDPT